MRIELPVELAGLFVEALAKLAGRDLGGIEGSDVAYDGTALTIPAPLAELASGIDIADLKAAHLESVKAGAKERVRSEIDRLSAQLTRNYTGTEEKGWLAMLAEAKAYLAANNPEDAPGLALDAMIRGDSIAVRATAVVNAAKVTALIPSLASGMRARAEKLIDATGADETQLAAVLRLLATKGKAILQAASQGDRDRIVEVATTGWDVEDQLAV